MHGAGGPPVATTPGPGGPYILPYMVRWTGYGADHPRRDIQTTIMTFKMIHTLMIINAVYFAVSKGS